MAVQFLRILIVEDNPADAELVRIAMRESPVPHEVAVSGDGGDALARLYAAETNRSEILPDIILLDINLPRMNGHEVLCQIKRAPALKKISSCNVFLVAMS